MKDGTRVPGKSATPVTAWEWELKPLPGGDTAGLIRIVKTRYLVVLDGKRRPIGLLDVQDLLKAGF